MAHLNDQVSERKLKTALTYNVSLWLINALIGIPEEWPWKVLSHIWVVSISPVPSLMFKLDCWHFPIYGKLCAYSSIFVIPLPRLYASIYWVALRIQSNGKTLNWTVRPFNKGEICAAMRRDGQSLILLFQTKSGISFTSICCGRPYSKIFNYSMIEIA
jgi:hypothetical protein